MNIKSEQIVIAIDENVIEDTSLHEPMSFDPFELESKQPIENDYTVAEVAKILGKSVRQVQRLLCRGILNGYKVAGPNGSEWRIRSSFNAASPKDTQVEALNSMMQEASQTIMQLKNEVAALKETLAMTLGKNKELERSVAVLLLQAELVNVLQDEVRGLRGVLTGVDREVYARLQDERSQWWQKIFK